jgi:hypothetical protein
MCAEKPSWYSFDVIVHALPKETRRRAAREVHGRKVTPLEMGPEEMGPFALTFEEAYARLAQLPRLFIEPDGSFVWTGQAEDAAWQVDGNLYDHAGRLWYVTAKGRCPSPTLEAFLRCLGWPETRLAFQLVREALWLDEDEFRRWASG